MFCALSVFIEIGVAGRLEGTVRAVAIGAAAVAELFMCEWEVRGWSDGGIGLRTFPHCGQYQPFLLASAI